MTRDDATGRSKGFEEGFKALRRIDEDRRGDPRTIRAPVLREPPCVCARDSAIAWGRHVRVGRGEVVNEITDRYRNRVHPASCAVESLREQGVSESRAHAFIDHRHCGLHSQSRRGGAASSSSRTSSSARSEGHPCGTSTRGAGTVRTARSSRSEETFNDGLLARCEVSSRRVTHGCDNRGDVTFPLPPSPSAPDFLLRPARR